MQFRKFALSTERLVFQLGVGNRRGTNLRDDYFERSFVFSFPTRFIFYQQKNRINIANDEWGKYELLVNKGDSIVFYLRTISYLSSILGLNVSSN